eukprot:10905362-Heterocapsa_arctica.AAC.1
MPCTALLLKDMNSLRTSVAVCSRLPDPETNPKARSLFILENPSRWNCAVSPLFFYESSCDRVACSSSPLPCVVQFPCPSCDA